MEPIKKKAPRHGQQLPPLPVTAAKIGERIASEVFLEEGQKLFPQLQEFRRDMHQNPEIGLELPRTQKKVIKKIINHSIRIINDI